MKKRVWGVGGDGEWGEMGRWGDGEMGRIFIKGNFRIITLNLEHPNLKPSTE
ncbi:MAG: hypothetical protein F6K55_12795 [Moorea sp. SIO4A3]|nr:hypothetical protein [Moorena sp. SIO4A3]